MIIVFASSLLFSILLIGTTPIKQSSTASTLNNDAKELFLVFAVRMIFCECSILKLFLLHLVINKKVLFYLLVIYMFHFCSIVLIWYLFFKGNIFFYIWSHFIYDFFSYFSNHVHLKIKNIFLVNTIIKKYIYCFNCFGKYCNLYYKYIDSY